MTQSAAPSSTPASTKPTVTIQRTGEALQCTINGTKYKIIQLQRMVPGSNQWQNLDIADTQALQALDSLVQRIEELATTMTATGQLDLKNASDFYVVGKRTFTQSGKKPPITFQEFVWKPEGSNVESRLKIDLESLPELLHPIAQNQMVEVGKAFAKTLDVTKPKPPVSQPKTNSTPQVSPSSFMTTIAGLGNCQPEAIAHELVRRLKPEEKASEAKRLKCSESELTEKLGFELRTKSAQLLNDLEVDELTPKIQSHLEDAVKAPVSEEHKPKLKAALEAIKGIDKETIVNTYIDYISQDQVYLDHISLMLSAKHLKLPIVLVVQDSSSGYKIQDFFPGTEDQSVEDENAIFVFFDGNNASSNGTGSRHYDHIDPQHQNTRQLVQQHKQQAVTKLMTELADCTQDEQSNINKLIAPISGLRKDYPNLLEAIRMYLLGCSGIILSEHPNKDDRSIASLLLDASKVSDFKSDEIQALARPKKPNLAANASS